jgi:hypothetical protein
MSRARLAVIIGGIVVGSLLAFCAGLLLTLMVIIPSRRSMDVVPEPTGTSLVAASPTVDLSPVARSTPAAPSPTPTYSIIVPTATPSGPASTPRSSATATTEGRATAPPSPTSTPGGFPFYYVEGSRVEELQCGHPYLQGWVRNADGSPLDGVTIRWQYWNNTEYAVSGDIRFLWQPGEFKFTYYAENPNLETDFVLQVVESADNPEPLSEPLLIHYVNCGTMGQITNIVFKRH